MGPEMKTKIAVLSDTHLNRVTREFEEILRRFLADADIIFHAGDFVSPEIVYFLNSDHFHGVYGNMDPGEVRDMLPNKKVIECGSKRIALIHGWGPPMGLEDRIWSEFQDVDVIVYGHSHHPANHMREGVLLFNPGPTFGYRPSAGNSIGMLEIGDTIEGKIIGI